MKRKKLEVLPVAPRVQIKQKEYELVPHIELVDGEKTLVVEVYYSRNEEPTWRIFANNTDYDTLDLQRRLWTHKELTELATKRYIKKNGNYRVCIGEGTMITQEGRKLLQEFTGIREELENEEYVIKWQQDTKKKKLDEKYKRITDRWDEEIGELPPLPEDWEEFTDREVVKNHYIFYQKTGTGIKAECQYCKGFIEKEKMRHNARETCPHCGKRAVTVNMARKDYWWESRKTWIAQRQGNRTVIRSFSVENKYSVGEYGTRVKKTKLVRPLSLILLYQNEESHWVWDRYKNRGGERWCSVLDKTYHGWAVWKEGCMYRSNAGEWKTEEGAGYLPLEQMPCEENINANLIFGAKKERIAAAEKMMKIGLWSLSVEALKGNIRGKTPKEMLKTENDDLEILKKAQADYQQYNFFQTLKQERKRPTAEELGQYREMHMTLAMIKKMIKYTTFHQIYKRYRYNSEQILRKYYDDYFDMCRELGFNMRADFVLFPKNIKKAHDDLILYYNEKKDEAEGRRRNGIYAKVAEMERHLNNLYGVEDETCLIRAPHDAAEIIREGHAMHHCVAGENYTKKMAAGKSYILFIRNKEKPDKPWYTLEISSGHMVVQVQGFANKDPDKIREQNIWKLLNQRLKELKTAKAAR